ncbi:MAG: hypothetical protein L6R40_007886 [Gallowayella cf. fulva]|nr:MAG: hypothetical protein L6R40_007886 [Xanthomendoza cf. fulva]
MHKPPLAPIIYARLYPTPKPTDPQNFQAHISKQLVPEVRAETARFYGHIDCVEAQYPGLDYAFTAHRLRLSRFPYHRRLFQVFDQLRLTNHEIQTLCKWEGTRWARERYEKDIGSSVRDTTWEGIADARPETPTVTRTELRGGTFLTPAAHDRLQQQMQLANDDDLMEDLVQNGQDEGHHGLDDEGAEEEQEQEQEDEEDEGEDEENVEESDEEADHLDPEPEESEDELQQSVGVELNRRLMAATEARNRGEEAVLDADWEQWLKEAAERGGIPDLTAANAAQAIAGPSTWPQAEQLPLATAFSAAAPANSTSAPPAGTAL